jgi:hypothetical protein
MRGADGRMRAETGRMRLADAENAACYSMWPAVQSDVCGLHTGS